MMEIQPQPGGQMEFLSRGEFEVLYGGSAGPGKTWALIIDALGPQFLLLSAGREAYMIPSYRAILFRRETKMFQKLLDESRKYYPHFGGKLTLSRTGDPGPCWEFPSGAKIFICHMEQEDDKYNHDGQEYQYVGWDEICQFTLTQYLHILSRVRSTTMEIPLRVRGTANPIGVGLWWVKKRFPVYDPFVTKHYIAAEDVEMNPAGKEVSPSNPNAVSRCFIPGYLYENAYLARDVQYKNRIMQMGSRMERALLKGDWDAFAGDFFAEFDQGNEIISPFRIPKEWTLIGSLDPGYSSYCSFGLNAMDFKGKVYRILTYYEKMRNPEANAIGILNTIRACPWTQGRMPDQIASGKDAWAQKDRLAIIEHTVTFADVFEKHGLILTPAHTDRKSGWWAWKQLMPHRYFVFKGSNNPLINEMISAIADEKDSEDIQGKGNDPEVYDHALDEQRYGILALAPPKLSIDKGDRGWEERMFSPLATQEDSSGWQPGMG